MNRRFIWVRFDFDGWGVCCWKLVEGVLVHRGRRRRPWSWWGDPDNHDVGVWGGAGGMLDWLGWGMLADACFSVRKVCPCPCATCILQFNIMM